MMKSMQKKLRRYVVPFALTESCRKLIFGGCLVTPAAAMQFTWRHVNLWRQPDSTTYTISWIPQQLRKLDSRNFFWWSLNIGALSGQCHLGPKHSCFTLIWRNLKKILLNLYFFMIISWFLIILGGQNSKKGLRVDVECLFIYLCGLQFNLYSFNPFIAEKQRKPIFTQFTS